MALTVQQLLTPMTAAQLRTTAVGVLQGLGLQPQDWAQGGIASSVLTTACNLLATLSSLLSSAIGQQWNPTATGAGLQLLSQYVYGFTPPQATFASGPYTLSNTGGGSYSYIAGQFVVQTTVANSSGQFPTYTNQTAFTLGPGTPSSPTTASFTISCTVVGTQGNAIAGAVTKLVTNALGVTGTNTAPVLGTDALTDPALRALNANSVAARGNAGGPPGSIAYAIGVATNPVSGQPVNINRSSTTTSGMGQITVVVASPTGPASASDVAGVQASITALALPMCVTLTVESAVAVNYSPPITVYILAPAGTSPATVATTINTALGVWFAGPTNPIGGITAADDAHASFTGIFETGVAGVIAQAVASLTGCTMISANFGGQGDLALSGNQVAVWAPVTPVRVVVMGS